ncbi:MAG: AsmA family protein [Gemmatimonadota bacterium]|nr:AsmA family protein [Gemmatimonadota bacterium]
MRSRGWNITIGRGLAVAVFFVVVAYAVVAIVLDRLVDPDELTAWLEPRASAALNREVRIGDASLVLLPWPGARLTEVRVANLPGFGGPPVLEIDRLRLHLAVLPLFTGDVRVRGMHLHRPTLTLMVDEGGASNFGDLMPEAREGAEAGSSFARLSLRRIGVTEGTVTYTHAPRERTVTLTGTDFDGRVASDGGDGWTVRATAESDSLGIARPSDTPPVWSVGPSASWTLHGDGMFDRVEITDGRIAYDGSSLEASGRWSDVRGPRPSLELRMTNDQIDAASLNAWIPAGLATALGADSTLALRGTAAAELRLLVPDPDTDGPFVRGEIRLDGVDVHRDEASLASTVSGVVAFEPGELTLNALNGTFAGGPFELYGRVAGPDGSMRLEAQARTDLAELEALGWTPPDPGFSGHADFDVTLAGSLRTPHRLELSGRATADGARIDHPWFAVPLYVPDGEITLDGRTVRWNELALLAGGDRFETTGRVVGLRPPFIPNAPAAASGGRTGGSSPPVVTASVDGARIDLDGLLGRADDREHDTYAKAAFAHLAGGARGSDGLTGYAPLESDPARPAASAFHGTLDLAFDSLFFRPYALDSVSAEVGLDDASVRVSDVAFRTWDGRGHGSLLLGTGATDRAPFELELGVEGVAATPFFAALTPADTAISGTLDLDVVLSGTTDRALLPVREDLVGSGTFTVSEGTIAGSGMNHALADFLGSRAWLEVPFDRWTTSFDVGDGMLDVRESALTGARGRVNLSGLIAFEGPVHLELGLSIPPSELADVSLRRTGIGADVLDRLRDTGSSLELGLRTGGSLGAPTLEPDGSVSVPGGS